MKYVSLQYTYELVNVLNLVPALPKVRVNVCVVLAVGHKSLAHEGRDSPSLEATWNVAVKSQANSHFHIRKPFQFSSSTVLVHLYDYKVLDTVLCTLYLLSIMLP